MYKEQYVMLNFFFILIHTVLCFYFNVATIALLIPHFLHHINYLIIRTQANVDLLGEGFYLYYFKHVRLICS